jgi:hypothetical protein
VPEVQANGNGGKVACFGSAGNCTGGHSPVLRNVPALPIHYVQLAPASATAGGSQFLLTVNGDDIRHDSVANWNGSFVVTTFVSTHQLFAVITAADIAQSGTVAIFVFNPPEGGTTFVSGGVGLISATACSGKNSNVVSFTIKP